MRTGRPKPRAPVASRDGGRASRQRGADCGRALRSNPNAGPDRAQTPRLTFLCAPEFPKTAPAQGPQAPSNPCPRPGSLSDSAALTPAVSRSLPRQRAGDGAPRGPSLLQRDYSARRARKRSLCFLRCPLVVGGSSIADIACLRKRIHSLHQIQDDGYLREAGERRENQEDIIGREL